MTNCPICKLPHARPVKTSKDKMYCPTCNAIFYAEGGIVIR